MEAAIRDARTMNGLVGGDVGADVRLTSGEIMFAFGDSILDTPISSHKAVRNSILAFSDEWACLVLGPSGSAFIPDRVDGVGYWPMSLVHIGDDSDGTVALFANRVKGAGEVGQFVNLGPAVVRVTMDDSGLPHAQEVVEIGPDTDVSGTIGWGAASWVHNDGHVYIYGTATPGEDMVFGWALHAARSTVENVFDPDAWEYWDGEQWVTESGATVPLIDADGGVSQTLSVFSEGGSWYAVSKKDDFLGEDVDIWMSPQPTGPFEVAEVAGDMPSDLEAGKLRYIALAHPTLFVEPGTIVLSISNNTTHLEAIADNPDLYRPEFWRAELP